MPVRNHRSFVLAVAELAGVALILSLGACGRDATRNSPTFTVDTLANGAIRVNNPSDGPWNADPSARWRVVEDLRIGRIEGTGPDVFGRVGSVLVDGLERIWVVDAYANGMKVFDADGRFVRTVGRKGAGPGEFMRVGRAFHGPDGEIWVEDLSLRRWEIFDTTGARIGGHRVTTTAHGFAGGRHLWTRDGRFLVEDQLPSAPNAPSRAVTIVYRRTANGVLAAEDTFAFPALSLRSMPPMITFESPDGHGHITVSVPFAPRPSMALGPDGDRWISEGGGRYEIRRQTLEGDTLLVIRRVYEPVAIPDSVRERALDSLIARYSSSIPRGDIDLGLVPRAYPPFDRWFISTDRLLWVRRNLGDGVVGFDVFGGDGRYLGQPDVPADLGTMRIQLITESHIYAVATDDLGVNYVVRLEIRRPPRGAG